ncbi:MAG: serine/threonine-protein phosphatase [Gemmatimonadales bacterium]|nr:MAG: serine/threonine-protein phosphatase [Gemmatimonadales bacterium]
MNASGDSGMTPKPTFDEFDAWGLTHQGLERRENQDACFVGFLARGRVIDATQVTGEERRQLRGERLVSMGIVADGVGSTEGGGEAARLAVRVLLDAVSRSVHEAERVEAEDPDVFSRLLNEAALDCHESLLARTEEEGGARRFATTLTLFLGLWPHAYLLQVGDSRCYVYRDGTLNQISRDQTVAQELVDQGVLTRTVAERTRWAHVLSSAMGGETAVPVVTRIVRNRGTVVLLCSDGLTKHVSDARIAERLEAIAGTDARQVAELLLEDALEGGGTDNVTVLVGRTLPTRDP